jgi:hypothetical protein
MLYDMCYMTHDTWQVKSIVSKSQVPSSNGLGGMVFEDLEGNDDWINELINELVTWVFVE